MIYFPAALGDTSQLVEKLILHVHCRNSHSSQDTTIAILRERFYIIHIREEVRRVLRNCIVCWHFATQPLRQKMGTLPSERVVPALPKRKFFSVFVRPCMIFSRLSPIMSVPAIHKKIIHNHLWPCLYCRIYLVNFFHFNYYLRLYMGRCCSNVDIYIFIFEGSYMAVDKKTCMIMHKQS